MDRGRDESFRGGCADVVRNRRSAFPRLRGRRKSARMHAFPVSSGCFGRCAAATGVRSAGRAIDPGGRPGPPCDAGLRDRSPTPPRDRGSRTPGEEKNAGLSASPSSRARWNRCAFLIHVPPRIAFHRKDERGDAPEREPPKVRSSSDVSATPSNSRKPLRRSPGWTDCTKVSTLIQRVCILSHSVPDPCGPPGYVLPLQSKTPHHM